MSGFTAINLSELPPPDVVETLDFEQILTGLKTDLIARHPDIAAALDLESEPIVKLLEVAAYRETLLRQRINDAGRSVMLAFAAGSDLDHIGALFGVSRAIIQAADPTAVPPVPEILEDDTRLRARIQLALEGFSTAGPIGAYTFHGLTSDPDVKDIDVSSSQPGRVDITVLSATGNGVPDAALLATVDAQLNRDEVRPLTDLVVIGPATVVNYTVEAALTLYEGPDSALVMAAAQAALEKYVADHHRLGHDITISGIHAALHQSGVQRVDLVTPAADIVVDHDHAAFCAGITVTFGGRDV
jgi:phage-related baseplate assembly protein